MPIPQEAGARGQVVDMATHNPIANARICIDRVPQRCVSSNAEGKFDFHPITKDIWRFFMIEPLISLKGRFIVEADGYRKQTINAGHSMAISVELSPSK